MIKGITDNVLPAFGRLGKLRKGGKKPTEGTGYGKDLNFFRFTSEQPEVATAFKVAYGDQPALLHVYLPYAAIDANWTTSREEWSAGGLVHRCDGEIATIWRTASGQYSNQQKACPYASKEGKEKGCKQVGRLTVILPELIRAGFVGYCVMETHSIHDLIAIQSSLLAVAEARQGSAQGLRGVEFILRRVPETISTPGTEGKRARREKWLVKLEPAPDWVTLQLEAARQMVFAQPEQRLQLSAGHVIDAGTGEILDGDQGFDDELDDDDDGNVARIVPEPARPAQPQATQPHGLHAGDIADALAETKRREAQQPPAQLAPVVAPTNGHNHDEAAGKAEFDALGKAPLSLAADAPAAEQHWIDSGLATRAQFFAWIRSQGMQDNEAYVALNCKTMHEYAGSKQDAKDAILAYLKRKFAAQARRETPAAA